MDAATALEGLAKARYQAEVLGNCVRALELADQAHGSCNDPEVRFHHRRLLSWLRSRLDARPTAAPSRIGEAWLPLLDQSSQEAFLARLTLEEAPGERPLLPPGSGAALTEAVERARHSVLRHLLAGRWLRPRPEAFSGRRLVLRGPGAASLLVEGGSAGAAAAVALCSCYTSLPVPGDLIFTGAVGPSGEILGVDFIEEKLRAARRERPWLRGILVPAAQATAARDPRVRPVATVGELVEAVFDAGPLRVAASAVDVEASLRLGLELYEKANDFAAALTVFETVQAAIAAGGHASQSDEFLACWRAGSCRVHLGDLDEAASQFERASALDAALWEAGLVSPQAHLGFLGNRAVWLRDQYRYAEAETLLRRNLALQRELRQDRRELGRTLGNLGELLTFMGRFDDAERTLREALEAMRAACPDEVPRELCYLGNLALRRQAAASARALFDEGLAANAEVAAGRELNEVFLRYGLARALLALGRPDDAVREADRGLAVMPFRPFPHQLILKVRGMARLASGRRDLGCADLRQAADLSFARGAFLRFGFSTARAELAIFLLRETNDRREAYEHVRRFVEAARAVPALAGAPMTALALERLLPPEQHDDERLIESLQQLADSFPY